MSRTHSKHRSAKSTNSNILVPEEIIQALAALPERKVLNYAKIDLAIKKYYKIRSARQIARVLNVCHNTVCNRIHKLGLK